MREHIARDMTELIGATPLLEAGRFFPRERGGPAAGQAGVPEPRRQREGPGRPVHD